MTVIDDYLVKLTPPEQAALQRVRDIVHQQVPDVEETFAYAIPTFKYKGKNLIHFSAFKNHLSIFPGGQATTAFADRLIGHKTSKGTVQFTLGNQLPDDLLKDMIAFCKHQIDTAT